MLNTTKARRGILRSPRCRFMSLTTSIREAAGMGDFLISELFTFAIESIVNTVMASVWPARSH